MRCILLTPSICIPGNNLLLPGRAVRLPDLRQLRLPLRSFQGLAPPPLRSHGHGSRDHDVLHRAEGGERQSEDQIQ